MSDIPLLPVSTTVPLTAGQPELKVRFILEYTLHSFETFSSAKSKWEPAAKVLSISQCSLLRFSHGVCRPQEVANTILTLCSPLLWMFMH